MEVYSLNFEFVDDDMAAVLRQKTEAERLAIAHGMWAHARRMILMVLRHQHRDWTDEQIGQEAARRLSHGAV
jgi:lauroyl/myristoyl acyltransferase